MLHTIPHQLVSCPPAHQNQEIISEAHACTISVTNVAAFKLKHCKELQEVLKVQGGNNIGNVGSLLIAPGDASDMLGGIRFGVCPVTIIIMRKHAGSVHWRQRC